MTKLLTVSQFVLLILVSALPGSSVVLSAHAQEEVTMTEEVRLGFDASFDFGPFSESDSVEEFGFEVASYSFTASGVARLRLEMLVEIGLSYQRDDLLPNADLPILITYTPMDVPEIVEIVIDASASVSGSASVALIGEVADIDEDISLAQMGEHFAAPLDSDPDVVVDAVSERVHVDVPILGEIASARLETELTLEPVLTQDFPDEPIGGGAGGAASFLSVQGARLVNPPPIGGIDGIPGVLDWNEAGEAFTVTVELDEAPGVILLALTPVLHWLEASADVVVNIDLEGVLDGLGLDDPAPRTVFSGGLGELLTGADTFIADFVGETSGLGFDPGFGTRIASGDFPIPLLNPEVDSIPPSDDRNEDGVVDFEDLSLGIVGFSINPDPDDDGLFDGTEVSIGTDPDDDDSDDDGLDDGEEVELGTDPLDTDTDNDGLTDGDEVNVHDCNPLDTDTDNDGLTDFEEVTVYDTLCDDADTDDDGLTDGQEVEHGTDPLDSDSDDDGILDGEDAEWVQNAINELPDSAFKNPSSNIRNAMLRVLDDVEAAVAAGDTELALELLNNLLNHLDGCGATADRNDWVVECDAQVSLREDVQTYIDNLSD